MGIEAIVEEAGKFPAGADLFQPLQIREVEFANRIGVSPMCMYSSKDGMPNDWHMVHLGSRAVGGSALVIAEATAIEARGRISPGDTGIYNDAQAEAWDRITRFIENQGAVPGIQLAHAGRKASMDLPVRGGKLLGEANGGWQTVSASAIAFAEDYSIPKSLTTSEIREIVTAWRKAAERALDAGFEVIEIHGAHGYLLNQFYSPLSNVREDEYGGSFENRTRLIREVSSAIREVWPERLPLFVRLSVTDWVEGGWDVEQSIELARVLKPLGVDLIDCSSGGNSPSAKIPVAPGYQVPLAEQVRRGADILTAAVGLITEPDQAQEIVSSGKADLVLLARELLRDPYWPRLAATTLGREIIPPDQYLRAW